MKRLRRYRGCWRTTLSVSLICGGLSLVGAAGCRTRLLDEFLDAASPSPADLGATPDLAQPPCALHSLVPVPVTEMRLLNPGQLDPGQQRVGSIIRVLIGVPIRPCDALGPVEVRGMSGNKVDRAVITAYVWRVPFNCGPPATSYRVAYITPDLGLSGTQLSIEDGAPGAATFFTVPVEPLPPGLGCAPVTVTGRCDLDCQCQASDPRTRCILDGPNGRCAIPCEEDADCPAVSAQSPPQACDTGFDYTCAVDPKHTCTTCPLGQACAGSQCRPIAPTPSAPCQCRADCPNHGQDRLCSDAHRCIAPCTTSADCDPSQTCTPDGFCKNP